MNINFQDHIPEDFDDNSKVWIYQSSRLFLISEAFEIEDLLKDFTTSWKSHGTPVKGYGNLFFGQFIVLMADETASGVSGCSTDSSVRLIKTIEEKFNVNMFDRQTLSFIVKERLQLLPLNQLNYAIENKFVDGDTLYFNNTVLTKKEFTEQWVIPAKDSWLGKKYSF
jgi:hypothetical protein